MPQVFKKEYVTSILLILLLAVFYFILYKIYIPRVNAFGCFDDCFNFMGGYFILDGKKIFSEFFFNHQPGMAFLSALVQYVTGPKSIPELILRHRQVMMLLSFLMGSLFVLRFGKFVLFSIVVYELTKYYVFGDRFLAEGLAVYLLIYQMGAVWEKLFYKKTLKLDLYIVPIFTWAVFFLREPLAPVTLALFAAFLCPIKFPLKKYVKAVMKPLLVFGVLTGITLVAIGIPDYYFNVFTLNQHVFNQDISQQSLPNMLLKSLFYPVYLIISPENWTFFRTFLGLLSGLFLGTIALYSIFYKKIYEVLFVVSTLTLSNLRPAEANRSFYEAFHITPWHGLFIFSISFLIYRLFCKSKKIGIILFSILTVILLNFIINKQYFAYENIDTSEEFFNNYSHVMEAGTVMRNLASADDSLFVDGLDDLIIWEAKLKSPYKYTWYTSFMPLVERYEKARIEMFKKSPPDFYYGACLNKHIFAKNEVSEILTKNYIELKAKPGQNCILISRKKARGITDEKKEKLQGTQFSF